MSKLAEIRAKLQKMEDRKNGKSSNYSDKTLYPHWNLNDGESATIRFLPDADLDNTFFWMERQVIKLPFPGIVGEADNKEVIVQVPCVEMWNETCPVLQEVRPWFNDPALEPSARKYWKKRTYFFQGLIRKDGLKEEEAPENPIRKFAITSQIFNSIKAALLDPDMENIPVDTENGTDYTVTKGTKGSWADYSTSKYSRKESALTQEERDAIEKYGLVDLKTYLPKRPSAAELAIILEMFEASVDGEKYDPAKWGQYYRPPGLEYAAPKTADSSTPAPAPAPAPTPAAEEANSPETPVFEEKVETPVAEAAEETPVAEAAAGAAASADDILAMIRNRG